MGPKFRSRASVGWIGPGWPWLDGARVGLGTQERRAGDHGSKLCAWVFPRSSCACVMSTSMRRCGLARRAGGGH